MTTIACARAARGVFRPLVLLAAVLLGLLLAPRNAGSQPPPTGSAAPMPAAASGAAKTGGDDPVRQAQALCDEGRYAEGRKVLIDARAERGRAPAERARVLLGLATFYDRHVGDHRRMLSYLREIERLGLPPDDPTRRAARTARNRVDALGVEYSEADAIVARAAGHPPDDAALRQRIEELTALTARQPQYPGLATAYHYLGQSYLRLGDYRLAYESYKRARTIRPAIEFSLPTGRQEAVAFDQWVRFELSRGSRAVLACLLGLGVVLLGRSKPWRWLGLRHAVALAVLLGTWWLGFRLLVRGLAGTMPTDLSAFPAPTELHTDLGTPLSGPLDALFAYGLVGMVGVFVIAAWTTRLRLRWTAVLTGGLASMLLVTSLMVQFVLEQNMASFEPAEGGRFRYLRGGFFYPMSSGQEPFMLTDPLRYCAFQQTISEMDEPDTKGWFERYAEACRAP